MGITGLLPLASPLLKSTECVNLGQTVAIDVSCWMHAGIATHATEIVNNSNLILAVNYVVDRINKIASNKSKVYVVFDGTSPEEKKKEKEKRTEESKRALEEYLQLKEKTTPTPAETRKLKTLAKQGVAATGCLKEVEKQVKILLQNIEKVTVVTALQEADPQLAFLVRNGQADYVMTRDSDLIIYGASALFPDLQAEQGLTNFYWGASGLYFSNAQLANAGVGACSGADIRELLRQPEPLARLRRLAVLMGSDYNAKLPGIGPVGILSIMCNQPSSCLLAPREQIRSIIHAMDKRESGIISTSYRTALRKVMENKDSTFFDNLEAAEKMFTKSRVKTVAQYRRDQTKMFYFREFVDVVDVQPNIVQPVPNDNRLISNAELQIFLHQNDMPVAEGMKREDLLKIYEGVKDKLSGINSNHYGYTVNWLKGAAVKKVQLERTSQCFQELAVPPITEPGWKNDNDVNQLIDLAPEIPTSIIQQYRDQKLASSKPKEVETARGWKLGSQLSVTKIFYYDDKKMKRITYYCHPNSGATGDTYVTIVCLSWKESDFKPIRIVNEIVRVYCTCRKGNGGLCKHFYSTILMLQSVHTTTNKDYRENWSKSGYNESRVVQPDRVISKGAKAAEASGNRIPGRIIMENLPVLIQCAAPVQSNQGDDIDDDYDSESDDDTNGEDDNGDDGDGDDGSDIDKSVDLHDRANDDVAEGKDNDTCCIS